MSTAARLDRRAEILDAALAAYNERGVIGASIEDIRRRSGASVGSIYHHFGGKEGIAGALYVEGLRDYQEGFLSALAGASDTRTGVEGAVRHHVAWISQNRELARFLLDTGAPASAGAARELRDTNRRFFRAVGAWVKPRVQAGELRELEPELLTALWIGPSHDLARHWLAGRSRVSPLDAAPVLAGAAWNSLKKED